MTINLSRERAPFAIYRALALLVVLAAMPTMGCSTATLSLESSPPNAEVYAKSLGSGEFRQIGETPINIRVSDVKQQFGGAGPAIIEFRKTGYTTSKVVVTELTTTDLSISVDLDPVSGLEDQERLNHIVDQVFDCQNLARAGRNEDALVKLRDLEREAPQLATIYELEGDIFYIQRKYREALDAFGLAVKLNPKNPQSIRMKSMLEVSLGLAPKSSAPASGSVGGKK